MGTCATSLSPCSALLTDAGADSLPALGASCEAPHMASLACAVASPWLTLAPGQDVQISKGTKELGPGVCSALKSLSSAWQCGGKASLPPSLALPDRRLGEILGLGCPNQGRRSTSACVTSQAAFLDHKTGRPTGSRLCPLKHTGPWGSHLFWQKGSPWGCALASRDSCCPLN